MMALQLKVKKLTNEKLLHSKMDLQKDLEKS